VKANLATLGFGALFGFVLGWARLHDPVTLHHMFRFAEPDVFLIMGSAIATAALATRLLRRTRARTWVGGEPVTWRTLAPSRNHVIGSVLFGLGWGLVCICPAPIAVLMGSGSLSGFTTGAGLMLGVALRDRLAPLASARPTSLPAAGAEIGL